MNDKKLNELKDIAVDVRKMILQSTHNAKSGHPGGSLSVADMIVYLYNVEMNIDPKNPKMEERDRFVLSKGHCAPALYAVLAKKGYFDKAEIANLRKIGSFLQGHPDMKRTPGVDMSTGSLGQGVSAACGMALAGKIDKKDYRVFVILGDGEIEEGQVWEAAMFAAHYKLDNMVWIVDNNGLQIDGRIEDVCSPYPIVEKFTAFGFNTYTVDGHDFEKIEEVVNQATVPNGKPTVIVQKTIKGKGISFMENKVEWHGVAPNAEQLKLAMEELNKCR